MIELDINGQAIKKTVTNGIWPSNPDARANSPWTFNVMEGSAAFFPLFLYIWWPVFSEKYIFRHDYEVKLTHLQRNSSFLFCLFIEYRQLFHLLNKEVKSAAAFLTSGGKTFRATLQLHLVVMLLISDILFWVRQQIMTHVLHKI